MIQRIKSHLASQYTEQDLSHQTTAVVDEEEKKEEEESEASTTAPSLSDEARV